MDDEKDDEKTDPTDEDRQVDNLRFFHPHPREERPELRRISLAELTHVVALVSRDQRESRLG